MQFLWRERARFLGVWVLLLPALARADFTSVGQFAGIFDKVVTVQPIQICNDEGTSCADTAALFPDFAIQAYAQANVAVALLPFKSIYQSQYLKGIAGQGNLLLPTDGISSNQKTLNAFFAKGIVDTPNAQGQYPTTFGRAFVNSNGLVVDSTAVMIPDPTTGLARKDTFAHELGHNFGLGHANFGAGQANNMLTNGDDRSAPTMVLTQAQIDRLRTSQFALDTPRLTLTHRLGTVDTGYTNTLSVSFDQLAQGVHLRRMTIDLPDPVLPSLTALGAGGRPYEYMANLTFSSTSRPDIDHSVQITGGESGFNGLLRGVECAGDGNGTIQTCYGENMQTYFPTGSASFPADPVFYTTNGAPEVVVDFAGSGGSLSFQQGEQFTIGMGLLTHHVHEEVADAVPWGDRLTGATITLEYDYGLATKGTLAAADAAYDSRSIVAIASFVAGPTPFGPQYLPGEGLPGGLTDDPDPVFLSAVPEPGQVALLLAGLVLVGGAARRHRR